MPTHILITGTSKGIGKYLAEYFISQGCVVFGCSRGAATVNRKNYYHFSVDITDEDSVVRMVRGIRKNYRKIDVLINNAAVASMNHILTTPTLTVQNIMNTNFLGTFILTREVSKLMIRQKSGKIVNFTTIATALKLEGEAIYAASKAAIESFTKVAAKELASFGITVNGIGPTPVKTDLVKAVPKDKIEEILEKQAIKRFATFTDISNIIDFFLKEDSDFVTGQIIYLGGVSN